ncbi:MAG: response regulator [Planctomycetaceae bacterium]|nr:response regulator [Planctomycetales bacterium]MCB9921546.1 response regulator [Planctomycetaceae bacterium]
MPTTKPAVTSQVAMSLRTAPLRRVRRPKHETLNSSPANKISDPFSIPTVFVVDDDPEMRESLELLLLAETLQVETYESADTFWADFHPERKGCVILDLRMPGMDGLALLELLADQDHELAVIVVSASANHDEKACAKRLGAYDVMSKPYDTKRLLGKIRECLSQ